MKRHWFQKACGAFFAFSALFLILPITGTAAEEASFSAEELAYIETCPPLKVGYVQDRKPVSFKGDNGELAGISRKIFDRISEISGLQFDYVELPDGSITYDYLLGEGFDFVTSVEYNEENQNAKGILISDPYLSSRKVIVAKDDFQFDMDAHCKVAISTGSQTIKKVISAYYPNFEFVDYPSTQDCFDAVHRGETDLLIQNQYVVEYWLYKPRYDDLKAIPIVELDDRLCFSAVTPLEKEETEIQQEKAMQISIINKSIAQMSDGEVAGFVITSNMENMYHFTTADLLYQYRYTLIALGIAVILICVLLYVIFQFRIRSIHDRADARAKGEFLSAMSHELRTPLNGLVGLNQMMCNHLDDPKKLSGYLQQSSSVTEYLLSLVNNILDMSRVQDHKMHLAQNPVDIAAVVAETEEAQRPGMAEKQIQFEVHADLPHPVILGDNIRIRQILSNMLDNARKYTQAGGAVTVILRQTKVGASEIQTVVDVKDNGRGISEEFQKKIFDPFTREQDSISLGNQGTGLGMAICSMLARSMNGSMSVKSKMGVGSCFTFAFTAAEAVPPAEAPAAEEQEHAVSTDEKPRILIAEDNELNAMIVTEMLTEAGFETVLATNGKQVTEIFEASAPGEFGVILMDVLMPEMNGFEAAKAIRALDRPDADQVKIIACTANALQEDRDKALESGMDDFMAKPLDFPVLLEKLTP